MVEETKENSNFLEIMTESLKKQIKAPIGYSTFQYCSLELLLTQRYLEEGTELYSDARHLYLIILAANSSFAQYKNDWKRLYQFFPVDSSLKNLSEKLNNFNSKLEHVLERLKQIR